ncbi:MAG: VOC family protein [Myxococcales bacterium]|nr:VOC family protein [Myxococcales bacterium]
MAAALPHHVLTILPVAEVAQAAAFYAAAFGWPVAVRVPVYVEFHLPGGQRLGLYEREAFSATAGLATPPPVGGAGAEIYLHTDSLDDAIAQVLAAGGRPLSPRAVRPWGDEAAYFADPDGHVVVVARPLG